MMTQSLPLNVYDCFAVNRGLLEQQFEQNRSATRSPSTSPWCPRLFGAWNIGASYLCNIQVPNQIVGRDYHFHVENWYARTNIPAADALMSWADMACVTFALNNTPVLQLPLSDLLRRKQGQAPGLAGRLPDGTTAADLLNNVAARMYEHSRGYAIGGQRLSWHEAPSDVRERFLEFSAIARTAYSPAPSIVVPPRAGVAVSVNTNQAATRSLLEVLPPLAPQALVWIHLEGHYESSIADQPRHAAVGGGGNTGAVATVSNLTPSSGGTQISGGGGFVHVGEVFKVNRSL